MSDGDPSSGERPPNGPFAPPVAPGMASPSAVSSQLGTGIVFGGSTAGTAEDTLNVRYGRHAITPIPWMIGAAALIAAAVWAVNWSDAVPGAEDPVASSEWWANVYSVLLPAHDLRLASYSQFRMWVALVVLVLAALGIAAWIGRIGQNLRHGHSPFGMLIPIISLPAWWVLPMTLGVTDGGTRARSDLLVRSLLAFGLLLGQFVLLRWPMVNRIWRAGRLPYDVGSVLLWLPMLIPWSMVLLSTSYTLMVTDTGDDPADSAWRPTEAMFDWARNITHATEVGLLVLLVAVTISQHIGILRDRRDEEERRQGRAELLPPPPA